MTHLSWERVECLLSALSHDPHLAHPVYRIMCRQEQRRVTMTYVKSIILIIVLLVLITFGVKNNQAIPLSYYFSISTSPLPLYGIVYSCIIIGIIIGMIVGVSQRITLRRKVKQLEREAREPRKIEEEKQEKEKGESWE